jgi:hypothetical protein
MAKEPGDTGLGPLSRLVDVIGQAATSGWAPTIRLAVLLIIGAIAVALIATAYR